jgi:hypothetical protein
MVRELALNAMRTIEGAAAVGYFGNGLRGAALVTAVYASCGESESRVPAIKPVEDEGLGRRSVRWRCCCGRLGSCGSRSRRRRAARTRTTGEPLRCCHT